MRPFIYCIENKMCKVPFFFLFQTWHAYCRFIIEAACFISKLKHYSWALCTAFSKPIRARRPAHPCKGWIFTFHCHVQWILMWPLQFNTTTSSQQFHAQLLNGFVNLLEDFPHYPIWSALTGARLSPLIFVLSCQVPSHQPIATM